MRSSLYPTFLTVLFLGTVACDQEKTLPDDHADMSVADVDMIPFCGNGIKEVGEECDDGEDNGTMNSNCADNCVNMGEQRYPVIADTGRDNDFSISDPQGNGEKIATDAVTGLVWQQMLPPFYKGCTVQYDGIGGGNACTREEAFSYCAELKYAGYDDWVVPTPHELASIIDYSKNAPAFYAVFKVDDYIYWDNYPFWTSAKWSGSGNTAWVIYFTNGLTQCIPEASNAVKVRCVRRLLKPEPRTDTRFTEETSPPGHIVVIDNWSGLSWTKDSAPYTVQKEQAQSYCGKLGYSWYNDWQLPELNELRSLVDYSRFAPASSFPDTWPGAAWWSSRYSIWFSTGENSPSMAKHMIFSASSDDYGLHCVRE